MGIEKNLWAMNDLDHARYLDRNRVVATHEDIPTLACPIDGKNLVRDVEQQVSGFNPSDSGQTDTMYYSGYPNQMDGEPLSSVLSGESSAK